MKSRVLFVGCAEKGAEDVRSVRTVSDVRWDARHADTAAEALRKLESEPCDFVVTKSRVGDVAGSDLLVTVRERFPHTVRMLLAPGGRSDASFDRADAIHQVLPSAFGEVEFDAAADRALRLRDLVSDPGLARLVREVRTLPSLPSLYRRITDEMRGEDPSLRRVGELVASDPAMTRSSTRRHSGLATKSPTRSRRSPFSASTLSRVSFCR